MEAEELRDLRRKWVGGPPPATHKAGVAAQLVIDDLIAECFRLREEIEGWKSSFEHEQRTAGRIIRELEDDVSYWKGQYDGCADWGHD